MVRGISFEDGETSSWMDNFNKYKTIIIPRIRKILGSNGFQYLVNKERLEISVEAEDTNYSEFLNIILSNIDIDVDLFLSLAQIVKIKNTFYIRIRHC